ncbi:hypothetical protein DFH09DRAFT_1081748 [Mycena vulgaris]|nr:hypothetical protein DFH09DRAFT_1081748 [Mycena vulgaris]
MGWLGINEETRHLVLRADANRICFQYFRTKGRWLGTSQVATRLPGEMRVVARNGIHSKCATMVMRRLTWSLGRGAARVWERRNRHDEGGRDLPAEIELTMDDVFVQVHGKKNIGATVDTTAKDSKNCPLKCLYQSQNNDHVVYVREGARWEVKSRTKNAATSTGIAVTIIEGKFVFQAAQWMAPKMLPTKHFMNKARWAPSSNVLSMDQNDGTELDTKGLYKHQCGNFKLGDGKDWIELKDHTYFSRTSKQQNLSGCKPHRQLRSDNYTQGTLVGWRHIWVHQDPGAHEDGGEAAPDDIKHPAAIVDVFAGVD